MTSTLVIDASIAIKWVVQEDGTQQAPRLRNRYDFAAPELFVDECANILWKKTQRGEPTAAESSIAAALLMQSNNDLFPMRTSLMRATELAIALGHPAYDCLYLSLAMEKGFRFVTADGRLIRRINEKAPGSLAALCISLEEASMS